MPIHNFLDISIEVLTCQGESHLMELVLTVMIITLIAIQAQQLWDNLSSEIPSLAIEWKIFHQALQMLFGSFGSSYLLHL